MGGSSFNPSDWASSTATLRGKSLHETNTAMGLIDTINPAK